MPIVVPDFAQIIETKWDEAVTPIFNHSPLDQQNPSYFKAYCKAIATGFASGIPSFVTVDSGSGGAPPIPGAGTGVGILIDKEFFKEKLYRYLALIPTEAGYKTMHGAYPPDNKVSEYLAAICEGISQATFEYYQTCWTLTSVHPLVYSGAGVINEGAFSGLDVSLISSQIQAAAPMMAGAFWAKNCQKIAQAYVETIHTKSTGAVTIIGVCVPNPSQACGIPMTGIGTGVAS